MFLLSLSFRHSEYQYFIKKGVVYPIWILTKKLEEVYQVVNTSEKGLSDTEAAERLKQNGKNELRAKPPKTLLQMLKEQILDPMVCILIVAAVISAVLQEWTEAGVIFAIVILNAAIGIVQE